jgi:hypothetical protein
MAERPRPWTVLPHGDLAQHDDNLWSAVGAIPDMPMPLERRMVIVRRGDGSLLIHNAMALAEHAMKAIEALGEPRVLVVPNGWHRLDAHAMKQRYPTIRVLCPEAAGEKVREVVAVDGHYDALDRDDALRVEILEGSKWGEGVFVIRSGARVTLLFNDTFMNQPHLPGFSGFVYKLLGCSGPARVHPFCKRTAKRKVLRAHLERLAAIPGLARVVPGHGDVVEQDAADVLAGVARAL